MATNGSAPEATYGFIGIGVMGYGMATNLRAKIPKSSNFVLCEINKAQRDKFVKEHEGVETAETPKELAQKAVSLAHSHIASLLRLGDYSEMLKN